MRIRPYIPGKDYEYVSKWIEDERTHAFWCANRLPYPITQQCFHDFLEKISEDNIGFLKFIIVDKAKRGKGYGKEMLNLALQYAFQIGAVVS